MFLSKGQNLALSFHHFVVPLPPGWRLWEEPARALVRLSKRFTEEYNFALSFRLAHARHLPPGGRLWEEPARAWVRLSKRFSERLNLALSFSLAYARQLSRLRARSTRGKTTLSCFLTRSCRFASRLRARSTRGKTTLSCFLTRSCRFASRLRARSRFESDSHLDCHSISKRRFATSRREAMGGARESMGMIK